MYHFPWKTPTSKDVETKSEAIISQKKQQIQKFFVGEKNEKKFCCDILKAKSNTHQMLNLIKYIEVIFHQNYKPKVNYVSV